MNSNDEIVYLYNIAPQLLASSNHEIFTAIHYCKNDEDFTLAAGDFINDNDDIFLFAECLPRNLEEHILPTGNEGYVLKHPDCPLQVPYTNPF